MPIRSTKDVPKQKNTQSSGSKKAFKEALNNALKHGDSEEVAYKKANSAATRAKKAKK